MVTKLSRNNGKFHDLWMINFISNVMAVHWATIPAHDSCPEFLSRGDSPLDLIFKRTWFPKWANTVNINTPSVFHLQDFAYV